MYNQTLAQLLAKASIFAYDFDPTDLPDLGNPSVQKFQDTNDPPTSAAALLSYADKRVLAFQGTITEISYAAVRDWLVNFQAKLVPGRFALPEGGFVEVPGRVHEGFADQLTMIFSDVVNALRGTAIPLYVTGHSQGGAIAALATKSLPMAGVPVTETYTFASPRPGDADFANSVSSPVCRLEYGDDIVPHVPFRIPDLGLLNAPFHTMLARSPLLMSELLSTASKEGTNYRSVGPLSYAAPDHPLQTDLSAADESRLNRERLFHLLIAGMNLVEHHHMQNYLDMVSS